MRPIVQSMIAKVSSTRHFISSATRRSRSVVASASTNNYKHDVRDIKRNRCTIMSNCLMDNRLSTKQNGSSTARLSSYTDRVNIHCRQFSSVKKKGDTEESNVSKVANDEIEDADLMAEVQEANERYVVHRCDGMI